MEIRPRGSDLTEDEPVLDAITPVLLTYNEAANIGRTLARLAWADDIVVVDSFSTDETVDLVRNYPQVRVFRRAFDTHALQWTYATQETDIKTEWILALDADYVVSEPLVDELRVLNPPAAVAAYSVAFRYCVYGRPLRASLYPPVQALFRRSEARYVQDGHTQRLVIQGVVPRLEGKIFHDDRKPLERWLNSQQRYAKLEAQHILSTRRELLGFNARMRLTGWAAPISVFFYVLLVKGCLFEGWPGWLYVLQRALAETMIALAVVEERTRDTLSREK